MTSIKYQSKQYFFNYKYQLLFIVIYVIIVIPINYDDYDYWFNGSNIK